MAVNASDFDNTILLYTSVEYDDLQIIQQHFESLVKDFPLLKRPSQLRQALDQNQHQTLIVFFNDSIASIYSVIEEYKSPYLTTILITYSNEPDLDNSPFDFVLSHDVTVTSHLQQIIQFKKQQTELHQNLTERMSKLEHQLTSEKQHSNQIEILKEAIVRNVSHELKTPLLHVKSAVSLMAEDMGTENTLIRYAENATARLETLVTNITMFGSSLDLNLGPVIVRDAVEYAHRNLRRIWESKEQAKRISLYIDQELPPVLADRQGLSTILQLLLDNALKFSEGAIEVHAHLIDDKIEISVKDYGIGIDPQYISNIFDSFYQIDHSSTRRYGGTGVGLALVKLLTEKHKSQITVESEPNKGSTFSFRLQIINFK